MQSQAVLGNKASKTPRRAAPRYAAEIEDTCAKRPVLTKQFASILKHQLYESKYPECSSPHAKLAKPQFKGVPSNTSTFTKEAGGVAEITALGCTALLTSTFGCAGDAVLWAASYTPCSNDGAAPALLVPLSAPPVTLLLIPALVLLLMPDELRCVSKAAVLTEGVRAAAGAIEGAGIALPTGPLRVAPAKEDCRAGLGAWQQARLQVRHQSRADYTVNTTQDVKGHRAHELSTKEWSCRPGAQISA